MASVTMRQRVADWTGHDSDLDKYVRHALIADRLWQSGR